MKQVEMVWITPNAEELIAYMARVSNPSNQDNKSTANKLVKYLVTNKHWSPLDMVDMCVEINTTRDIARQILRHRSFFFQEFSQRYAIPTEFQVREARLQDAKNRQNSIDTDNLHLKYLWENYQKKVMEVAQDAYNWAITNNIAKEQARVVLPEGNTMSRMYMKGTIRSWIHYVQVRTDESTQKEHRDIAMQCKQLLLDNVPSLEYTWTK